MLARRLFGPWLFIHPLHKHERQARYRERISFRQSFYAGIAGDTGLRDKDLAEEIAKNTDQRTDSAGNRPSPVWARLRFCD